MSHAAIIGMTKGGKTTVAVELAHDFRRRGFHVLVLDRWKQRHWPASFITDSLETFLRVAQRSERCALFVEESGNFGRDPTFEWIVTQSRQWGHVAHYLSQYHTQVPPIVRANVERLFLFKCGLRGAKEWAEEFARPELVAMVADLPRHHFILANKYEAPRIVSVRVRHARSSAPVRFRGAAGVDDGKLQLIA